MAKFGMGGELVKCSFCGKPPKVVKKLIAGPGVFICNECVALCDDIIANEVDTWSMLTAAFEPSGATTGDSEVMFERFTDRARRVLVLAQEEARLLNHSFIGTEHLLLGLISEGEGLAAKALESLDISLKAVREKVEETIGPAGSAPTGSPPFTPRAKKVLELSLREALQLGHDYIGTEHILLGIVREGEGVAAHVLISLLPVSGEPRATSAGADLSRVRQQVMQLLSGYQGLETGVAVRRGMHPRKAITELPPMSVGESWTAQIVGAGRRPEEFAVSYERLATLLMRLGIDIDDSRIRVTSVETSEGPGLCLTVMHETADDSTASSGDDGEDASGDEPPA